MRPKILVGCPTSHHKDYCLTEYMAGLKKLTYPNKKILIVENSKNDEYFKKFELESGELSNTNVNYHQYPPHGEGTYSHIIPFYMEDDKDYNGEMFTENFVGVFDYLENFVDKNKFSTYYKRFDNERPERTNILRDYYLNISDLRIKRLYDIGMINLSHSLLKANNIKHLILTDDT